MSVVISGPHSVYSEEKGATLAPHIVATPGTNGFHQTPTLSVGNDGGFILKNVNTFTLVSVIYNLLKNITKTDFFYNLINKAHVYSASICISRLSLKLSSCLFCFGLHLKTISLTKHLLVPLWSVFLRTIPLNNYAPVFSALVCTSCSG